MRFRLPGKRHSGAYPLLRHNMFIKLMMAFSLIAGLSIAMLSYFLFSYISRSMIENELEIQQEAIERVSGHLEAQQESMQRFMNNIYRDGRLSQDMVYYLRHSFDEYVRYRLDQSNEVSLAYPPRITDTINNTLEDDANIRNIMLYGSEGQYLHVYGQNRAPRILHTNGSLSYIPDVMSMEGGAVSLPNVWVRKAAGLSDSSLYAMRMAITDPLSMTNIGQLMFYYPTDALHNVLRSYQSKLKGYIVVMSLDGKVLFDSTGTYYGKQYPYMSNFNSLNGRAMFEEDSYFTTLSHYQSGYIVAGVATAQDLSVAYQGLKQMMVIISLAAIAVVVILPSLVVINFAKRTYKIIRFMRKVEGGDLDVRLTDKREDELGQISRSFNGMMDELSRYIERVYKAEIRQKHTELSALQARIQPHFLYNTLEVIRMRAVAKGAHDVGDMIYSLAMLFKSFVNPSHDALLREELENCRLYLELFRIRYQDLFSYSIEYDPALGQQKVIRMLLQPIIENYIVHGIRKDSRNNRLEIRATMEGTDIKVVVSDNGHGIEGAKLEKVMEALSLPETGEQSFGLRSVHERLQLRYGGTYGLHIASNGEGTVVTLKFPAGQ